MMTNEPPPMEGTSSQYSQTQVFSCTECTYAFTSQVFLHKHIKRSHNDLYCQMLRTGQIPSPAGAQITRTVTTSQIQGDPDKPSSSTHQQLTKTLPTHPVEVKTHEKTYTEKKAHNCKKCDRSFSKLDDLKSHQCIHIAGKQTDAPSPPQSVHRGSLDDEPLPLALPLDGVGSQSPQTQVSDSDCPYTLACQIFHDNMTRSLNNIYFQMLSSGQIPSASFQKLASSVNSQLQGGDTHEPRPYSHQRVTKTLTQPGEVKSPQLTKKTHICKECDKSFNNLGDLKAHQRKHTGEKPYPCQQCGKRFSHLSTLRSHQLIHTGEKPFQCNVCNKSFSHLTSLRSHQLIHTGEKSFHCKYCDKSFYHSGNLSRHERVHHGEARLRPTPRPNLEANVTDT